MTLWGTNYTTLLVIALRSKNCTTLWGTYYIASLGANDIASRNMNHVALIEAKNINV